MEQAAREKEPADTDDIPFIVHDYYSMNGVCREAGEPHMQSTVGVILSRAKDLGEAAVYI